MHNCKHNFSSRRRKHTIKYTQNRLWIDVVYRRRRESIADGSPEDRDCPHRNCSRCCRDLADPAPHLVSNR